MNALYKSEDYKVVDESHGGADIPHKIWTFIGVYDSQRIGCYFSSINDVKSFFNFDFIRKKGIVVSVDGEKYKAKFTNQVSNEIEEIEFTISDDCNDLRIEKGNAWLINCNFKRVDLDFETIAQKFGQTIRYVKILDSDKKETEFSLVNGAEVEVIKQEDNWVQIIPENNSKRIGWIPASAVRMWSLNDNA